MSDEQNDQQKSVPRPDGKIIKEGGYQPTSDPGPVPTNLIRPATDKPEKPAPPLQDKKD